MTAAKDGVEMNSYSPASAQQPVNAEQVTYWDLYECAAKNQYGANIQVMKTPWATKQLDNLNFEVSVLCANMNPTEANEPST